MHPEFAPTESPWKPWFERIAHNPLPAWKLYSGWKIPGDLGYLRVAHFVRNACRAEQDGCRTRANFFWGHAHAALPRDWAKASPAVAAVREMLWATHWAVVRGSILGKEAASLQAGERAWGHLLWIESLAAALPDLTQTERDDLLTLRRLHVDALDHAGHFDEAVKACEALSQSLPDSAEVAARLSGLHMKAVSTSIKKHEQDDYVVSNLLETVVLRHEELRKHIAPNLAILENEAALRQAWAFRQAKTNRVSSALLEMRKALVLEPNLSGGSELFNKLVEVMQDLVKQKEQIRAELAGNPGKTLTPQGERMMRDAGSGFGPVNKFIDSDEEKQLIDVRQEALERHCWNEIGAGPFIRNEASRALVLCLGGILSEPPADAGGIPGAWQQQVDSHPELAAIPSLGIHAFLARRIFGTSAAGVEPAAARSITPGPVFSPGSPTAKGDSEPAEAWVYSPCDYRIKAQCLAAIFVVLIALFLGVREWRNRGIRADAYLQAQSAAASDDLIRVMEACSRFDRHGLLASDDREAAVAYMYDQALVQWMIRDNPKPEETMRRLSDRPKTKGKQI